VIDGPFAETKELIAGFWLWQVRSMDEAEIEWVKRCADATRLARRQATAEETEVEIRPVFEAEDFGEEVHPELRSRRSACAQDETSSAS
jgi:hypothetical protein